MPSSARCKFLLSVLSLTLFLSGCFKSPSPEVELQELRAQAEERLLQDAKLAFFRSDYPEAVLLFNRFVNNHRTSNLAAEAQWWLARSYHQMGNLRLALARFQRLAQSEKPHPYRHEARLRANDLIDMLGLESVASTIKGHLVKFQHLKQQTEFSSQMDATRFRKGGVLLLDLGCPLKEVPHQSSGARVMEDTQGQSEFWDKLDVVIKEAAQAGQAVYLGVSLPCLGLLALDSTERTSQWHEWVFDPQVGRVRVSSYLSLFSSGYQVALQDILSRLSQSNIAGIVFREEVPLGLRDGLSPIARNRFEEVFDVSLNTATLFSHGQPTRISQGALEERPDLSASVYPEIFWKWAGWKSRERLRVMKVIVEYLRGQFSHLQFGREIHPESIDDPVYALAHFSEDWVDTAQAPFDFFVTRFPDPSSAGGSSNSIEGFPSYSKDLQQDIVQRMVNYLNDPQKVWVIHPDQEIHPDLGSVLAQNRLSPIVWPEGVGEIMEIPSLP